MQAVLSTFLNPVFPVFAIMLVGIVLTKRGVFNGESAVAINRFVFFVAVPCLLFSLLSQADIGLVDRRLLALYFLSELVLFATGAATARLLFRSSAAEALLLGMASCFVNHVFFVLPIAQRLYGAPAEAAITAIIVTDSAIIFAGTIIALEWAAHRGQSLWRLGRMFSRNPVLLAIAAGLLVNLFGLRLHPGIVTFAAFAGNAAAPAALFGLGIILAAAGGWQLDYQALSITGFKLLLHPLVAWLLFSSLTDIDPLWRDPALLVAAGPCGAMPFVLALQYNIEARSISSAIIYSTAASLVTLSILA